MDGGSGRGSGTGGSRCESPARALLGERMHSTNADTVPPVNRGGVLSTTVGALEASWSSFPSWPSRPRIAFCRFSSESQGFSPVVREFPDHLQLGRGGRIRSPVGAGREAE